MHFLFPINAKSVVLFKYYNCCWRGEKPGIKSRVEMLSRANDKIRTSNEELLHNEMLLNCFNPVDLLSKFVNI